MAHWWAIKFAIFPRQRCQPESIEWCTVWRTRLSRRRLIWLHPPFLLYGQHVVSLSHSSCVSPVELPEGRGVFGGGGWKVNHTTGRKPGPYKSFNTLWSWSFIYNSILSGVRDNICYMLHFSAESPASDSNLFKKIQFLQHIYEL